MSLLKCENLSFAYDGVTVVRDLNFTVEEGNYLCIIGENGAGWRKEIIFVLSGKTAQARAR